MRLPFRITVCGIDELSGHCEAGVSHVLSILDPGHPEPSAFGSFGEHVRLELRFNDIIEEAPDMQMPSRLHVEQLLAFGRTLPTEAQAHLLVHCHAGISRSSASMTLLLAQAMPDCPAAAIFDEVLRIRPIIWPNLRILELGDAALRRDGALIEAAAGLYGRQLERRPELSELYRGNGRGREVQMGRMDGVTNG
ncbi:MAG TPA: protein-tyrosine-phosphatase [Acetobacteraceae bacterium]|nr:protein-tyrosine-phosphatase [Acetobacteraceae bacterium]